MTGEIIVRGYCNRCGDCCKPPQMAAKRMLDETRKKCKLLSYQDNIAVCEITAGQHNDDVQVKPETVSQEDFDFWLKYCKPFPRPKDLGHHAPPNCSFYRVLSKPSGEEVILSDGNIL